MSAFRYGVIGAGRQGTAAAFDLVVRADAEEVLLAELAQHLRRRRGVEPAAC